MKYKASIIILDFKKSKRVCENVKSIQAQVTDFPFEVVIVDNSCDLKNSEKLKTLNKYSNVQVHTNKENVGYIKGNNQGAKASNGEYLFIVNPDIIWPKKDILQKMINYMDKNPEIGILGPRQINDNDNSIAMTVRAFPKFFLQIARRTVLRKVPGIKNLVSYDEMKHLNYDKIQEVDWLQSSFWAIKKNLWDSFGGLNHDYLIFMSDPDLCFKVWQKGYKVVYYPDVTVKADGVRCSEGGFGTFFKKWTLRQHVKDAIKYSWNHLFKGNPRG